MSRQTGSAARWTLAIVAVVALVAIAGLWFMREHALAVYEISTRRALAATGLELESMESSVGRLAYWQAGEGPTVVLIHGAGDQAGAWRGVVTSLLREHRLLLPDVAGHGDSEPIAGPLPMTVMYSGLEQLLAKELGEEQAILVGSSMGAWLATIHAHRHPEQVARVVAINGGALRGDRSDLSLMPADREEARALMAALRDPSSPPTPDFVLDDIVEQSAVGPIGRMSAEWEDLEAHLLEERLGEIFVPFDLLWGESDQLMTLAYAGRMATQLPRSRITIIEGCGHHPANECPEKLVVELAEVLRMEPPAAKPVIELIEETEPPSLEDDG